MGDIILMPRIQDDARAAHPSSRRYRVETDSGCVFVSTAESAIDIAKHTPGVVAIEAIL